MKNVSALALLLSILAAPVASPAATAPQTIVLAGGCFWGMQAVFQSLKGVKATAGYAGGAASTAHYETVSGGDTGHAESVEVVYDPAQISLQQILDVYFLVAHDPTELNRKARTRARSTVRRFSIRPPSSGRPPRRPSRPSRGPTPTRIRS